MSKICSICQTVISSEDNIKICEKCGSIYHAECWEENGGCATYGCELAPKSVKTSREPSTYWGRETKTCPMCGETIKIDALECPYCKEKFDTPEPITIENIKKRFEDTSEDTKLYKIATIIFISALLGITSPFNLFFGGIWYKKYNEKLKNLNLTYYFIAGMGLLISLLYLVVIIFFAFYFQSK